MADRIEVTYHGKRSVNDSARALVFRDDRPLDPGPSQAIRNHSPDGFEWGYGGSGPAQLSLALLLDALGENIAKRWYQDFKFAVVARLRPNAPWHIKRSEIVKWWSEHVTPEYFVALEQVRAEIRVRLIELAESHAFGGLSGADLVNALFAAAEELGMNPPG